LNFQKTILIQAINYSLDKISDQNLIEMISLKYQFWVLKTINKNAEATGILYSNYISQEELNQSLVHLEEEITKENFREKNFIFILKAAYELGFYYYLKNDFNKTKIFFDFCASKRALLKDTDTKLLYFRIEDLQDLLEVILPSLADSDFEKENDEDLKELFYSETNESNNRKIKNNNEDVVMLGAEEDSLGNKKANSFKMDIENTQEQEFKRFSDKNYFVDYDKIDARTYQYEILNFHNEKNLSLKLRSEMNVFFDKNGIQSEAEKEIIEVLFLL